MSRDTLLSAKGVIKTDERYFWKHKICEKFLEQLSMMSGISRHTCKVTKIGVLEDNESKIYKLL